MIDIHSHVLPGIDDGARTLEESISLVKELERQGFTDVVATPHYMVDSPYVSSKNNNLKLLRTLREALKEAGIHVNLYLGNEIYINDNIDTLVQRGKISSMNGGEYLLVELPMSGDYPNYEDVLLDLVAAGYKVILAHPERYSTFQDDFSLPTNLYNAGILLQCNLGSVLGRHGRKSKKCVTKLIKQKMVFAFGSDIHRCHDEDVFTKAVGKLKKYYSDKELEQVLTLNARKMLTVIR